MDLRKYYLDNTSSKVLIRYILSNIKQRLLKNPNNSRERNHHLAVLAQSYINNLEPTNSTESETKQEVDTEDSTVQTNTDNKVHYQNNLNWDDCNPETNGEYQLLVDLSKEWQVCFDIGANRGEYTEKLLKYAPASHVHSFEPNSSAADYIKKSRRITKNIMAIGDSDNPVTININQEDDTQSSTYRKNSATKAVKIPQTTLDKYCQQNNLMHIDFIKIDTEGHDVAVLKGAQELIKNRQIDFMQIEYGGTYIDAKTKLQTVYELLQADYLIFQILPRGILPIKYSQAVETYQYSNWLAISKNITQINNRRD